MGKKKLKSSKKLTRSLIVWMFLFMAMAAFALYVILSKGSIFNIDLIETTERVVLDKPQKIEVESDAQYIAVDNKDTAKLTTKVDDEISTEGIEFISSDEKIATVSEDGIVTPKSVGMVTITARKDDLTASTEVYVIKPIKTMNLTCTSKSIRVGNDLQMKLVTTPSDASIETLSFSSSDEGIATVNANGIVTGVSKGQAKITVHDAYKDEEKSVTVTIR